MHPGYRTSPRDKPCDPSHPLASSDSTETASMPHGSSPCYLLAAMHVQASACPHSTMDRSHRNRSRSEVSDRSPYVSPSSGPAVLDGLNELGMKIQDNGTIDSRRLCYRHVTHLYSIPRNASGNVTVPRTSLSGCSYVIVPVANALYISSNNFAASSENPKDLNVGTTAFKGAC